MQRMFESLQPILDIPFVRRVRRNHGLEHATIHVLSDAVKKLSVVGRSDARGFYLFGNIPTDIVKKAVHKARERMLNGEHDLAVHPNCGTNLVTAASLSAVAVFGALIGSEHERGGKLARLPLAMAGIMFALVLAQPLGSRIQQEITTLGDLGDLEVLDITLRKRGNMTIHRISTRSS